MDCLVGRCGFDLGLVVVCGLFCFVIAFSYELYIITLLCGCVLVFVLLCLFWIWVVWCLFDVGVCFVVCAFDLACFGCCVTWWIWFYLVLLVVEFCCFSVVLFGCLGLVFGWLVVLGVCLVCVVASVC